MGQLGKLFSVEGLELFPLREIFHEQGSILHMLRSDAPHFKNFGEVYFSYVKMGMFKGFKRHLKMTQFLTVPIGSVEFIIRDADNKNIERIVLGLPDNYALLKIPPMLWYGFKGLSEGPNLVANCADMPHQPEEIEREGWRF